MSDKDQKFFTVNVSVTAGGASFRPGICYSLEPSIEPAIMKMVENKQARLFDEEVRIVSGKPYPVNKPLAQPSAQAVANGAPSSFSNKRGLTTKL
jgi:hypothetical protein